MKIFGFISLFASFGFVVANIFSGLILTQNSESELVDGHFLRGALLIIFNILGNIFLIQSSKKSLNTLEENLLDSNNQDEARSKLHALHEKKQKAFIGAITAILISLVSLITGTVSHGGQFPLLHGGLGFVLTLIVIWNLLQWFLFFRALKKA